MFANCRSQADMAGGASARGLITMNDAMVHTEQAANFVVAQRHGTTFHLKAASEVDRQRWVTALELAKHRAIKAQEAEEEAEMRYAIDDQFDPEKAKNDMQQSLHVMNAKVQDLLTCQDLLGECEHSRRCTRAFMCVQASTAHNCIRRLPNWNINWWLAATAIRQHMLD
jgi:hypothetical protein